MCSRLRSDAVDHRRKLVRRCLIFAMLGVVVPAKSTSVGLAQEQVPPTPAGTIHTTVVDSTEHPRVAQCQFRMWIPSATQVVRVIIVINQRAAGKRLFFEDNEWKAMAARQSAAMMYCEREARGVRHNGLGESILKACEQFSSQLGRPELGNAPFILWGHSMGGRVVQDFVRFQPNRVLAFHIALRAVPSAPEFMKEEYPAIQVPGLYLMAEQDAQPHDILQHYQRARNHESARAWVVLPKQNHWPRGMSFSRDDTTLDDWRAWGAHEVVIPWTEAIIQLRLPANDNPRESKIKLLPINTEKGWLGQLRTGKVSPASSGNFVPSESAWFPTQEVANAWSSYSFGRTRQASR